jgi:hypothetical protein
VLGRGKLERRGLGPGWDLCGLLLDRPRRRSRPLGDARILRGVAPKRGAAAARALLTIALALLFGAFARRP